MDVVGAAQARQAVRAARAASSAATFPALTVAVNGVCGASDFPDAEVCPPTARQRSPGCKCEMRMTDGCAER